LALLLGGNFVVGVGLPLLVDVFSERALSRTEQALVALAIFTALSAVEILLKVESIYGLRLTEFGIWKQRNSLDQTLNEIRTGLHDIVVDSGTRDTFFLDHYARELDFLNGRVQDTIANREIQIERHHIDSTHVLLSIYDSPDNTVFRATAVCADVGDEFDITYEVYFNEWLKRLKNGTVTSLRRIFIYSSREELAHPNLIKLLAFHVGETPGLEAKLVPAREYMRFKDDYHVQDASLDIGIFSDQYVYLGRTRREDNISGYFSREKRLIAVHTDVFDGVWNSAWAVPVGRFIHQSITADELFDSSFALPSTPSGTGHGDNGVLAPNHNQF